MVISHDKLNSGVLKSQIDAPDKGVRIKSWGVSGILQYFKKRDSIFSPSDLMLSDFF